MSVRDDPGTAITTADDLADLGDAAGMLDRPSVGFYSSPAWLSACAELCSEPQRFLVARDGGRPVLTLPFTVPTDESNSGYRPTTHYPFRAEEPYLLLGPRRGYRSHWAAEPGPAGPAALQYAARLAAEHGRAWVYALYLTTATADLLAAGAEGAPPVVPSLSAAPDCFLPAPGGGMDDYLAGLAPRRRAELRAEHRRVLRVPGIGFRLGRLADDADALAPLLLESLARHGTQRTLDDVRFELDVLARHAGDLETLLVVEEHGRPVGFNLCYEWGGRLWGRHIAVVDRLRTSATPILLHLQFRWALERCYERGLDGVHLGPTNLATKLRRGARLEPLWHVGICKGREVLRPEGVRHQTEEVIRIIEAQCGGYAPAEDLAAMRAKALGFAVETAPTRTLR